MHSRIHHPCSSTAHPSIDRLIDTTTFRHLLWVVALIALQAFSPGLSGSEAFAQYMLSGPPPEPEGQVDGKKIVRATVFPLGALDAGGDPLDSLQKLSLNTVTYFHNTMAEHVGTSRDTLGALAGGGWLWEWSGIRGRDSYVEQRMYTFSGYERPDDRPFDHAVTKDGRPAFWLMTGSSTQNGEHRIGGTDTLGLDLDKDTLPNSHYTGKYILRLPRDFATANNWDGNLYRRQYAQYYDFIYRFDSLDLASVASNSVLYTIEVWVRGAKTHDKYNQTLYGTPKWKLYDTVYTFPITKAIYQAALDTASDLDWWTGDLNHGVRISANNQRYARLRMLFDSLLMDRYYNAGRTETDTLASRYKGEEWFFTGGPDDNRGFRNNAMFDVRIYRNAGSAVPIYVKGLRVRNGGAEKLLTGQLDSELDTAFTRTAKSLYMDGSQLKQGSYYNRLLNIHTESEPYPDRFYILAYLDRYAAYHPDNYNGKPSYKRITTFSPWQTRQSRLIWDDILWKPNQPTASPEHLYKNIDYQSGDNIHLGIPDDVFPKTGKQGLNLLQQYRILDGDISTYEREHDSILRIGYRDGLREANHAAFGLGAKRIPFWIMAQAYIGITWKNKQTGKTDNGYDPDLLPESQWKPYVVNTFKAWLADPSTQSCEQIGRKLFDVSKIYDTTTMGLDRAHVTSEQIRLQANLAVAWGASGFTVSNTGTNGLREVGTNTIDFKHEAELPDTTGHHFKYIRNLDLSDSLYYQVDNKDSSGVNWWFTKDANLDPAHYDYRLSGCDPTRKGKWIPYRNPNTSSLWCLNDCASIASVWSWMNTFYGFKTRFNGVKRGMSDINRVAETLSRLSWQAVYDYSGTDASFGSSPSPLIPVREVNGVIQKRKIMQSLADMSYEDSLFTNQLVKDQTASKLYEVGAFIDTLDPAARYLYFVNRHTWPNRTSDDPDVDGTFLGNVSVRRAEFLVNRSAFGRDSNARWWFVTDVATDSTSLIHDTDYYRYIVQPGEGRLFKIAPASPIHLGQVAAVGLTYNNGRRIADLGAEGDTSTRIAVWQSKGKIYYRVLNESGHSEFLNYVHPASGKNPKLLSSPPPDAVDSHPSVASNGLTVSLVWTRTSGGLRTVMFVVAEPSTDWNTLSGLGNVGVLDVVPPSDSNLSHLVTPVVTPVSGGYFYAWSHPTAGIKYRIMERYNYAITAVDSTIAETQSADGRAVFPTVASRQNEPTPDGFERIHLAWEEKVGPKTHQIYYQRFDRSLSDLDSIYVNTIERVTKGSASCEHHHPSIAVANAWELYDNSPPVISRGGPVVSWEMVMQEAGCDPDIGEFTKNTVYVMSRERSATAGWGAFHAHYPKPDNLPLPVVRAGAGDEIVSLVFQDSFANDVHIHRLNRLGLQQTQWFHTKLNDKSRTPHSALQYYNTEPDQLDTDGYIGTPLRTVLYRGIVPDTSNEYPARVTAFDVGSEIYQRTLLH